MTEKMMLQISKTAATDDLYQSISDLIEAVREATRLYRDAAERTGSARRDECGALNRLNESQKKLDEALGAMRKEAPAESAWAVQPRRANVLTELANAAEPTKRREARDEG